MALLNPRLKAVLRRYQTRFPAMIEAQFALQRLWCQVARSPFEDEFRLLNRLAHNADEVFVDVGANRGLGIQAVRLAIPKSRIVAFEPNAALAERLSRRYAADPLVTIHAAGLGEVPGTFTLFVPTYAGTSFDTLASLDEESARDWLTPRRLAQFDEEQLGMKKLECTVQTLDAHNLAPCLIKIDVQGTELAVLRGGRDTIAQHRPVVIAEVEHNAPAATFLGELGYLAYGLIDGRLERNRSGASNTVFVHGDHRRGMVP